MHNDNAATLDRDALLKFFIILSFLQLLVVSFGNLLPLFATPPSVRLVALLANGISGIALLVLWQLARMNYAQPSAIVYLMAMGVSIPLWSPFERLSEIVLLYATPALAASFVFTPAVVFLFGAFAAVVYTLGYFVFGAPLYDYSAVLLLGLGAVVAWGLARAVERTLARSHQLDVAHRETIEQLPLGFYRVAKNGEILETNSTLAHILGYPTKAMLAAVNLAALYADQRARETLRTRVAAEQVVSAESEWRRYDGVLIWVREHLRAVRDARGEVSCYEGTIEEVTARRHAETEMRHRAEVVLQLYESLRDLVIPSNLDALLQTLVTRARALVEATECRLYLYQPDREELVLVEATQSGAQAGERIALGEQAVGQVAQSRTPLLMDDATLAAYLPTAQPTRHSGSKMVVPLMLGEKLIGVLSIARADTVRRFKEDDLELIKLFAEHAAAAIEQARNIKFAAQAVEQAHQFTVAMTRLPGATSQAVLRAAGEELVHFGVCALEIMAQPDGVLAHTHTTIEPTRRDALATLSAQLEPPSTFPVAVIESAWEQLGKGQPVFVPDFLSRVTAALPRETDAILGWLAKQQLPDVALLVPVQRDARLLGFIALLSHQASPGMLPAIAAFSRQISFALAHACLSEDLAKRRETTPVIDHLRQYCEMLNRTVDQILDRWTSALEFHERETQGHIRRVAERTVALARALQITEGEIIHLRRGAILHDVGKLGIPESVWAKRDPLTSEEWALVRQHPALAYDMLAPIEYLGAALEIPHCHHERWDGAGYPRGLRGAEIPLSARIFAVVDIWDALMSERPYRAAWDAERAREHIHSLAGTHLDPQVVSAFIETF